MNYDFILGSMKFSYSSASSYHTCPFGFFLTYIEAEERIGNGFSSYGNYIHNILEKFFSGELKQEQLLTYYENNYGQVDEPFPPYPAGMAQNYYDQGYEFFESFDFDFDSYEPVIIEDFISTQHNGINLIVKPDLVIKDKQSGEHYLVDYKTAKLYPGKKGKDKIAEYMKQFYLYCYFIEKTRGIVIDKIKIWFIRDLVEHIEIVDRKQMEDTIVWFEDTIRQIMNEQEWKPNNGSSNKYFCNQLCGVRSHCPHRIY